ncbi:MAG: hypothetical protein QM723_40285 [Myxococcaceae bacterium]
MASDNDTVVLVDSGNLGRAVIPGGTSLSRLNYYDGKVLRASDMTLEQSYLMSLVALSNHGLGAGVVHGFDAQLAGGDQVTLGSGLAIDPQGHPLFLPQPVTLKLQEIIDASIPRQAGNGATATAPGAGLLFNDCVEVAAPPTTVTTPVGDLFVLAICRAEAFCGLEDVYGKLCEQACMTATQRPYVREGVVVRMIPLQLVAPPLSSNQFPIAGDLWLRSQVAHQFFADEVARHPSALSRTGLLSNVWCLGSQYDANCCEVPLAVVARAGGTTRFLDPWIPRRERIDAPAKQYWQWRMRQRPWSVFLAQVLQFQCQLAHLLDELPPANDPCADARSVLQQTAQLLDAVKDGEAASQAMTLLNLSFNAIGQLKQKLLGVLNQGGGAAPKSRILLQRGIAELPPAGYLPVVLNDGSVNAQVRALLGDGLDYRFCICRPDYIGHAFEAAQHLDRISLVQGLDHPDDKPKIDVLVPDGKMLGQELDSQGLYSAVLSVGTSITKTVSSYQGVARERALSTGGSQLTVAAGGASKDAVQKYASWLQPLVAAKLNNTKAAGVKVPVGNVVLGKANPGFMRLGSNELNAMKTNANRVSWAAEMRTPLEMAPAARANGNSADGVWLSAHSDDDLEALKLNTLTNAAARGIYAVLTPGEPPYSIEADFTGTLMPVAELQPQAGESRRYRVQASGLVHLIVSVDSTDPNHPSERLLTFATRSSWEFELAFGNGVQKATLRPNAEYAVELARNQPGTNADVSYVLSMIVDLNGTETTTHVAELALKADAGILDPAQADHVVAELALGVLQGTRLVTEPAFQKQAEEELFPELVMDDPGLVIQPTLDWVFFTRRREKQCTRSFQPPPVQLQPRRYQVLNITADNLEQANQLAGQLSDPAKRVQLLQQALKYSQPALYVDFAGGSPQGLFNPGDVDLDWDNFHPHPGNAIWGVAWGAPGDDDATVQSGRLLNLTAALADSPMRANPTKVPLSPFPTNLSVAGAEGIFLFITLEQRVYVDVVELSEADDGTANGVLTLVQKKIGTAQLDAVIKELKAKAIGTAIFDRGAPSGTSVDTVVQQYDQYAPSRGLLWTQTKDDHQDDEESASAQVLSQLRGKFPGAKAAGALLTKSTATKPSLMLGNDNLQNPILFVAPQERPAIPVLVWKSWLGNVIGVFNPPPVTATTHLSASMDVTLDAGQSLGASQQVTLVQVLVVTDGQTNGDQIAQAYIDWAPSQKITVPAAAPPKVTVMTRAQADQAKALDKIKNQLTAGEPVVILGVR